MCKRLQFLDYLRGLAILCVVIDHIFAWIDLPPAVTSAKQFFIFSVTPLFFLAGVTYALSYARRPSGLTLSSYCRLFWHKASRLIFVYLVGLFLTLAWSQQSLDFPLYARQLLIFPHQFYFIAIYLQLLLVGPFLSQIWAFCQKNLPFRSFSLKVFIPALILLLIASFSGFFPVLGAAATWAPAKVLFGGIQLWIFGLGTLAAYLHQHQKLQLFTIMPFSLTFFGFAGLIFLKISGLLDHIFHHPPNFATICYCATLGLIFTGCYLFACHLRFSFLLRFFRYLGRHSLDIFIYHPLFIQIWREFIPPLFTAWPLAHILWQFSFLTFATCLCSIILTYLLDQIFKLLNTAFQSARL